MQSDCKALGAANIGKDNDATYKTHYNLWVTEASNRFARQIIAVIF